MRVAIIGSRNLKISNLERFVPEECDEIVSGGAIGVDICAAEFARKNKISLVEFLPNYKKYGRGAPIVRNNKSLSILMR